MASVKYADLWGLRDGKYSYLLENDISKTNWQLIEPVSPYFFLVAKEFELQSEYDQFWSLTAVFGTGVPEKDRGISWGSGVKTNRDFLLIDFDKNILENRIQMLADTLVSDDEVKSRLGLEDGSYWDTHRERQKIREVDWRRNITRHLYRPFDKRWLLYQPNLIEIHRGGASKFVMRHVLAGENMGLVVDRTTSIDVPFTHIFVSNSPIDVRVLPDYGGAPYIFPVYLYSTHEENKPTLFTAEKTARKPNLSATFLAAISQKLGMSFVPDGKGDLEETFGPEDIFHYAYAVFHSPTYRTRYAEFLKIDFPRLPLTSDEELFKALVEKGAELVSLHLMESPTLNKPITKYPITGSNTVEKVSYDDNNQWVYINKTQYFEGIPPEVWEFRIGGYQVAEKWLKDRKGRTLTYDELTHYQKVIVASTETIRLMNEIDELISGWPIE